MRLIATQSCSPGLKLGKCIYNEDGVILLNQHVELTQPLIYRLQRLGIDYVYVMDPATDDVQVPDMLSDQTRMRALTEVRTHFKSFMAESSTSRYSKNPIIGKAFRNVMNMIIDDMSSLQGTLVMLMNMNVLNNYLYQHSINVCIYATMLGMINGYKREDLVTLGIGSLLHDIGKTKINQKLIGKPGKLTEEEFAELKLHTEIGFKMLKDEPNIPLLAAHCAFQHHEREDGSGYPRGLKGNEIHDFAKWVAVADSYDAMTTHRAHRQAMLPHQAMEILFAGVGSLYDQKKVSLFRDNVAIYPLGLPVTLSTGEKGVVVRIIPAAPQRPVIRVLQDPSGGPVHAPYEVDLSNKLTVFISQVNV